MSIYVEIDMSVDEEGGLRLRSGAQRFHEGPISFAFPMLFSGIADVREWYDETRNASASWWKYETRRGGRCSDITEASRSSG